MRAWIWMGAALVVACRGRKSAPETHCPPVDAILMPLETERAELHQKFPPASPERWIERGVIDEDAAIALEEADLPEELSADARAAYIAYLRSMSAKAAELGEQYNAIADFDKTQDELRDRIDEYSEGMNAVCNDGVEGGCQFEPPLPPDPEGSLESLRAFVEKAQHSHVQAPHAEKLWQLLLGSLKERVAAMEEEAERTARIETLEAAFDAAIAEEAALRAALVVGCPSGLREEVSPAVDVAPAPQQNLPPVEGQAPEGGIPAVPTMPTTGDGGGGSADGYNFAQPLDPSAAPGADPTQRPADPEAVGSPGDPPPPGDVPPGGDGASAPPQMTPGEP